MIDVENLNKSFGELHILKDVSENIKKGEKVNHNVNPEQVLDAETTLIVITNTAKLGKLK